MNLIQHKTDLKVKSVSRAHEFLLILSLNENVENSK